MQALEAHNWIHVLALYVLMLRQAVYIEYMSIVTTTGYMLHMNKQSSIHIRQQYNAYTILITSFSTTTGNAHASLTSTVHKRTKTAR